MLGKEMGYEITTCQMQYDANNKETDQKDPCFIYSRGNGPRVTHKSTVARTVMCRQDGRERFPVLLDDLSKCRTNSQRKSQLS